MLNYIYFFLFIPLLAFILLVINLTFAPYNPYGQKRNVFECGFTSFFGQNRTQFSISFFIFALLFLLFDLEILLVYPYLMSSYNNGLYGLIIILVFLLVLTLGFAFELGKKALSIDSKQIYNSYILQILKTNYFNKLSANPNKLSLLINKNNIFYLIIALLFIIINKFIFLKMSLLLEITRYFNLPFIFIIAAIIYFVKINLKSQEFNKYILLFTCIISMAMYCFTPFIVSYIYIDNIKDFVNYIFHLTLAPFFGNIIVNFVESFAIENNALHMVMGGPEFGPSNPKSTNIPRPLLPKSTEPDIEASSSKSTNSSQPNVEASSSKDTNTGGPESSSAESQEKMLDETYAKSKREEDLRKRRIRYDENKERLRKVARDQYHQRPELQKEQTKRYFDKKRGNTNTIELNTSSLYSEEQLQESQNVEQNQNVEKNKNKQVKKSNIHDILN